MLSEHVMALHAGKTRYITSSSVYVDWRSSVVS